MCQFLAQNVNDQAHDVKKTYLFANE